ncbi:MAG: sensor histidine kinase [Bacteroidales bacterium]
MQSSLKLLKPFVVRNAIIASIGFGILIFIDYIVEGSFFRSFFNQKHIYLLIIAGYILASEGTLWIDKWLTQKHSARLPLTYLNLYKILATIAFYISLYLVFYIIITPEPFARKTLITILISIVYVILIDLILIISRYKDKLQKEQEANARLKEEKLKSDLHALQNQLNPHFLFNSLNVLVSEIYEDADKAVKYIGQLSDIFRYVLQSSENFTVPLQDELEFLNSYIYLYKVRYGEALQVNTDPALTELHAEIPPMVLQILVENCLKHNKIMLTDPLIINIKKDGDQILVENNLIKKTDTFSTTTGLANIRRRYSLLKNMDIFVEETSTHFRVRIPVIL